VTFSKKTPRGDRSLSARAHRPAIARTVVVALAALLFCVWALVRHYTFVPKPMLVPAAPSAAPTYDADAGETPVPELYR
jgi:hypothetical protein